MAGMFGSWGDKSWNEALLDAVNLPDALVQSGLGRLAGDKNVPSVSDLVSGDKTYDFSRIKKAVEDNYGVDLTAGDDPNSLTNLGVDIAGNLLTSPTTYIGGALFTKAPKLAKAGLGAVLGATGKSVYDMFADPAQAAEPQQVEETTPMKRQVLNQAPLDVVADFVKPKTKEEKIRWLKNRGSQRVFEDDAYRAPEVQELQQVPEVQQAPPTLPTATQAPQAEPAEAPVSWGMPEKPKDFGYTLDTRGSATILDELSDASTRAGGPQYRKLADNPIFQGLSAEEMDKINRAKDLEQADVYSTAGKNLAGSEKYLGEAANRELGRRQTGLNSQANLMMAMARIKEAQSRSDQARKDRLVQAIGNRQMQQEKMQLLRDKAKGKSTPSVKLQELINASDSGAIDQETAANLIQKYLKDAGYSAE